MKITHLSDLLDVDKLQQLQDLFSEATGLASIITTPEGELITRPSNFCEFCFNSIRKTEKGMINYVYSDAQLGTQNLNETSRLTFADGGLWDAGVSINIKGVHLANWLIGQVRNEGQNREDILKYTGKVVANHEVFSEGVMNIPLVSKEQITKVTNMLYAFVTDYTEKALANYELKRAIKEIKQKEKELNWERTLLKALMDNIPDHIYFKDRQSRFLRSNLSQAHYFRIDDPELTKGKTDFDFFDDEHAAAAFADEQQIIEHEITISKEEKETWHDRPDTWVSTVKAPLRDLTGDIIGTFGISRDITEKKAIEEQLIQSEDRFRAIVENMGEGLGIVNEDEEFIFTNPSADDIFGVESGGLIGRNLREFIDADSLVEILKQTVLRKKGQKSIYEIDIHRPTGEIRSIIVSSVPKRDKEGNFIGTYGVFRDITQRKIDEEIIKKQNVELKEINSQKDKFFSIIAHDLRSPFNSFLGLTEFMEKELNRMSRDEIKVVATNMKDSAIRIYNLLSNLLEWSRMQRGLVNLQPQCFLLNDVVHQCIDSLLEMALNKMIDIQNKIPTDFEVKADPNMLQIIMQNLISNALKFTSDMGAIVIDAQLLPEKEIQISVSDNGIGMSTEMKEKLFRIDVNNSRPGTHNEASTGLGLLLCKEFIEKHGGRIWVESEEGKGSTFTISIPDKTTD